MNRGELNQIEKIRITRHYDIILPGQDGMVLNISPLPKTMFILFLRHPEGICRTLLGKFRDEMIDIYVTISPRANLRSMRKSIDGIISLESNMFHTHKFRLTRDLGRYFGETVVSSYSVHLGEDGRNYIPLSPSMVEWE